MMQCKCNAAVEMILMRLAMQKVNVILIQYPVECRVFL